MASLQFDRKLGAYRLQFTHPQDGSRRSVRLGPIERTTAELFQRHVKHLLACIRLDEPCSESTMRWMAGLSDELHERLAKAGLAESRQKRRAQRITLGQWLNAFIASRTDVKPATRESYDRCRKSLIAHFGADRRLDSIDRAAARKWRLWLATKGNRRDKNRQSVADATVRRRTAIAKQIFSAAVEDRRIKENPFKDLPSGDRPNPQRQAFVEAAVIETLIAAAEPQLGLVLALARFAGLRIPSEIAGMLWTDIDLPNGRLLIRSPKTEHHGLAQRFMPIHSPVLRRLLEDAHERAPDGAVKVFPKITPQSNLREAVEKLARRCGVKLWPKLFVNLRSSLETELLDKYPAADVASWMGHTVAIQQKHYAQVRQETFQRAVAEGLSGANGAENALVQAGGGAESGAVRGGQGAPLSGLAAPAIPQKPCETHEKSLGVAPCLCHPVGGTGLEPVTPAV